MFCLGQQGQLITFDVLLNDKTFYIHKYIILKCIISLYFFLSMQECIAFSHECTFYHQPCDILSYSLSKSVYL